MRRVGSQNTGIPGIQPKRSGAQRDPNSQGHQTSCTHPLHLRRGSIRAFFHARRQAEVQQHPASNDGSCVAAQTISAVCHAPNKTVLTPRPFARPPARQIVISARCSIISQTSRQVVQELNPSSATGTPSVTNVLCRRTRSVPHFSSSRCFFQLETSKE